MFEFVIDAFLSLIPEIKKTTSGKEIFLQEIE